MESFGKRNYYLEYKKRVCSYGIIKNAENEYLVIVDEDENLFLVGGKIEFGENANDALLRESLEETGFEIKIDEYIGMAEKHWVSSKYPDWSQHNIAYFFTCDVVGKVCEPVEKEEMRWVSLSELEEKLFHEHHMYMINKLLK